MEPEACLLLGSAYCSCFGCVFCSRPFLKLVCSFLLLFLVFVRSALFRGSRVNQDLLCDCHALGVAGHAVVEFFREKRHDRVEELEAGVYQSVEHAVYGVLRRVHALLTIDRGLDQLLLSK